MKPLRYFITFIAAFIIISACQKELTGDNSILPASGNLLKDTSGDCAPVTVGGVYVQNTVLGSGSYMDVQVNFTSTGGYEITSDTVNGYFFKGTGQAATTGVSMVRLMAAGTPIVAGTDAFRIRFDTSTCDVTVQVNALLASFTFGNTAGVCTAPAINGNYITGVALTTSNNAVVQVNVTAPGAYAINTDTVNSMSFSASGNFTTTGQQTVLLTGSGTPSAGGSFTFTTAVTGGCTFVVSVVNPTGSLAQLTTVAATAITCTTGIAGGIITSDGGSPITARGIVYATTTNPTTANSIINSGTGTGTFVSNLTGLIPGTTYYARAFATNSAGTAYGNNITFNTASGCQVTVYVAGRDDVYNISGNIPTPKVWVKPAGTFIGTGLPFPPGVYDSQATGVFATSTDVYVAGTSNEMAMLWKNGIGTPLGNGYADGLYVVGTDVYVAGTEQTYATLWKNGVPTALSTTAGSQALSVFVSGSDVYVAGYEPEQIGSNYKWVAKVWKNGVPTSLSNGANDAIASSVFVSGNDVYVAVNDGDAAKVWKNGLSTTLPSGSNRAVANSIFVLGTDVYVAGTETDGNSLNWFAKLWKNGVGTNLTPTSNYRNQALSVYVAGTNVYVAGSYTTSTGANSRAAVWINGVLTPLTSGATDAVGQAIFVR